MNNTSIAWTHATWNPMSGCDRVSPGCDHCFAESIARRFAGSKAWPNGFALTLHPDRLDEPRRMRKPALVFVNSMSDLFHERVPADYIAQVFAVMADCPQHEFQILTKRARRMASLVPYGNLRELVEAHAGRRVPWPLPNVWLGVSVESENYDFRTAALAATPAAVRFVSAEPLLEPALTANDAFDGIDWVIIGGESGPGARRMPPVAAASIVERCRAEGVAVFFKQTGSVLAREWRMTGKGEDLDELPGYWRYLNVREWPASKVERVAQIAEARSCG